MSYYHFCLAACDPAQGVISFSAKRFGRSAVGSLRPENWQIFRFFWVARSETVFFFPLGFGDSKQEDASRNSMWHPPQQQVISQQKMLAILKNHLLQRAWRNTSIMAWPVDSVEMIVSWNGDTDKWMVSHLIYFNSNHWRVIMTRRQLERAYDVQNNDLVELRIGGFQLMRCCHPSKEVVFSQVFLGINRELPQMQRFLMLGKDKGKGR